jgi:hypothetical protein
MTPEMLQSPFCRDDPKAFVARHFHVMCPIWNVELRQFWIIWNKKLKLGTKIIVWMQYQPCTWWTRRLRLVQRYVRTK